MAVDVHQAERAIDAALDARDAGRPEQGVPILDAALRLQAGYPRLWQVLGLLHRELGDGGAAAAAFGRAAALAPRDFKIAHSLAQTSLEAGYPALAHFERACRLAPADGDLLIGRAAAQLAEGQGVAAIADLETMLSHNPLWLAGHQTFARINVMLGTAAATRTLEAAIARAPQAVELWTAWLNILIEAGRHADADAVMARARSAMGHDPLFDRFEAVIADELGDSARAARLFAALGGIGDTAHAVRHARHLLRTGQAPAAAALVDPLLDRSDADQIWPYAALAWRLIGDPRADWLEGDEALVGVFDLDIAPFAAALADRLRSLHSAVAAPLGQSVHGGTQTDGPLLMRADPEIRVLRATLVDAVEHHIARLGTRDPAHPTRRHIGRGFRFHGSWSVRLRGGGRHSNHIHPQGWLSSAFYVSVPPQEEMGEAPAGWLALGSPPAELGLDLPPLRMVEPKVGRLILFPSTMWHGTLPIAAGERLTVAFDIAAMG